jgi:hypothetical protein
MSDPWILTSALCSLICALLSLLYGCLYIIRFSTMKKMHKAAQCTTKTDRSGSCKADQYLLQLAVKVGHRQ